MQAWRLISAFCLTTISALPQPKLLSPELHPDRRVTLRLHAPKATQVEAWGEWISKYNATEKMTRDQEGNWSTTLDPIVPGIYSYIFLVDGLILLDPGNPNSYLGREGPAGSLLHIKANHPQPYEVQPVPHGALHTHTYNSHQGLGPRKAIVYTPPAYSRNANPSFPVLYLLHGSGDNERSWTDVGRAATIADNLIAAGLAKPMIIVMPECHITPPEAPDPNPEDFRKRFAEDLTGDLIPLVESNYRAIRSRAGRAIAGLSMGAYQAMWFAMDHPERVSSVGIFSGGIFVPAAEGEADIVKYATSPAATKFPFQPFPIAIGDRDMNLPLSKKLDAILTQHNLKHEFQITPGAGHTWPFWRQSLINYLPRLFR